MHQEVHHPEVSSDPCASYPCCCFMMRSLQLLCNGCPKSSQDYLTAELGCTSCCYYCCLVKCFLYPVVLFLDQDFLPDLKRFSESCVRTSKLSTFVNFPLKDLDLREFSWDGSGEFPHVQDQHHTTTVLLLASKRFEYLEING